MKTSLIISSNLCYRFLFIVGVAIILTLQSCNNSTANESLVRENELLRKQLNEELKEQVTQTKYVWSIIYFKSGSFTWGSADPKGHFKPGSIQDKIFWSDISEVNDFNEDKKYMLLDELEENLRSKYRVNVHSIQKREAHEFNSYKEASEFRNSIVN